MKAIRRMLVAVLLLLILLPAGTYLFVKSTLPDYEGRYQLSGINGRIEIFRDGSAVPHIFADHQNVAVVPCFAERDRGRVMPARGHSRQEQHPLQVTCVAFVEGVYRWTR